MALPFRWLALLVACGAPMLAACDECQTGTPATCDDGSLRTCQSTGALFTGASWNLQKCVAPNPYCALGGPNELQATCVASPDPAPVCAANPGGNYCYQGVSVSCLAGYLEATGDGVNDDDPTCANANSTCFEGNVYLCACGRRTNLFENCMSAGQPCTANASSSGMDHICGISEPEYDACFQDETGASCSDATACSD